MGDVLACEERDVAVGSVDVFFYMPDCEVSLIMSLGENLGRKGAYQFALSALSTIIIVQGWGFGHSSCPTMSV